MKNLLQYKVFSGALQFTVFIGVLIALLLSGLLILAYSHNFFTLQSKATIENIKLLNVGIHNTLENIPQSNDTIVIDAVDNENQKVEVHYARWGIFDRAIVKTTHRKKVFYKSAFIGTQIKQQERPALYLKENYKPLVVVGSTIIKGNVFLPNQGVRPGNIAGNSFYGQELIQGSSKTSTDSLPKIQDGFRKNLEDLLVNQLPSDEKSYLGESQLRRHTHSFIKPTKMYYSKEPIVLDACILKGNLIIRSEKAIKIKSTSLLCDLLVIAPVVEIEDNVRGNFQVIARKTIKVGKNCKLDYPSALILIQDRNKPLPVITDESDNQILIDEGSKIKGSVLYFESVKENNFKIQVLVNKNTTITGEVYCEGNLQLSGNVSGSIYTNQFVVNEGGSMFMNHLYNAQINSTTIPPSFCGIVFGNSKKGIAKWLY